MAPEVSGSVTDNDKSEALGFANEQRGAAVAASGRARGATLPAEESIETVKREEWLAATDRAAHEDVIASESAENSMLQDTDAILSRIEDGIAKERKAVDALFARIRQNAA